MAEKKVQEKSDTPKFDKLPKEEQTLINNIISSERIVEIYQHPEKRGEKYRDSEEHKKHVIERKETFADFSKSDLQAIFKITETLRATETSKCVDSNYSAPCPTPPSPPLVPGSDGRYTRG
ncbi:MAG: hypothetical protein ABL867_07520 [Rickettsiales bacterium]